MDEITYVLGSGPIDYEFQAVENGNCWFEQELSFTDSDGDSALIFNHSSYAVIVAPSLATDDVHPGIYSVVDNGMITIDTSEVSVAGVYTLTYTIIGKIMEPDTMWWNGITSANERVDSVWCSEVEVGEAVSTV